MNKAVGISVVIVVLLGVVAGGYYLTQGVDGFVKSMIERVGSDTTKTAVRVQDVKISLTEGSGQLSGLTIANPPGFSSGNLFSMSDIKVAIDTASLARDVYVIKEITVAGPSILVEQAGTTTNLQVLKNGMDSGATGTTETSSSSETSDTRLAVNELNFTDGNVLLKSDVFGERVITLPGIALRDLGSAENGLTPEELGQEIAAQLIGQLRDVVSDELKKIAREEANRRLKEKVGETAAEGINKLKGLLGGKDG